MNPLNKFWLVASISSSTLMYGSELPKKVSEKSSKTTRGMVSSTQKDEVQLPKDVFSTTLKIEDAVSEIRVGDRIRIKLDKKAEPDLLASLEILPLVWAISTYGLHEHKFSEKLTYLVKGISYGIPNPKGKGIKINKTNPPLKAELYPLGIKPDPYLRVFWYLDLDSGVLAQHEDGSAIADIESITFF